ncbi:hypothetical protein SAMN05192588_0763 [Nonlabens sp. Hel1_33_55]|uniref:hypothetical protein n=1 Tax=Nonlabens sp. Hel1_33_55 TaxID=1336802 RepID=UPI000875B083|nr:hypothetical protein [Nonlabens sp. Hel1_33_55]SCY02011.1 hypothetical protein SAMN05192588_0763 [Nonlabens sp. Hel1_33_55]
MLHPRTGIILIALGSVIVIIGILFYFLEIVGATGMILIGIIVEIIGGVSFLRNRKNRRK